MREIKMGKHSSQSNVHGPYRVAFVDEFTGEKSAEDFGFSYATVEEARQQAETAWKETNEMSDEASASNIKWEGAIGTCSYETSFGGVPGKTQAFTCHFIITRY